MTAKRQKTTSETAPKSARNRAGRGVRGAYTWENVRAGVLDRLHSKSLRKVADDLGLKTHSAVQRIRDGIEPHDPTTREILSLPKLGLAPKCWKCGACHTTKRCTRKPTFEERAEQYESWKAANADELRRRVRWAEWQTVPKGK